VPFYYVFCEIEVPDALVAPWNVTGEVALARIESEVLSREWGDAWLKGLQGLLMTPTPHQARSIRSVKIPARSIRSIKIPSSSIKIPVSPEGGRLPVHAVPSVIIPREMNYLINPAHQRFDELTWREPQPFRFDPRLISPAK